MFARMPKLTKTKRLRDSYRFPGFHPALTVVGLFGDPHARVIRLTRRSKKTMCGVCGRVQRGWYDSKLRRVRDLPCGGMRIYLEIGIRRIDCRSCQGVKQERLDWLANNPFYTKRFAFHIGRRCRNSSIRDVAKEQLLDWKTVKALEMQYMLEQIKRAGHPRPKVLSVLTRSRSEKAKPTVLS
jgi:transposase